MDKRLYVFEEIDCSHWRNIVLSRKLRADDEAAVSRVTNNINDLADCLKSALCSEKPKDKDKECGDLCLGDLLEVLDGMVEVSGRMYIMTSNHPEVLDPALCRPGRIDLQHEFKKLTRGNISDMYKLWFDEELPTSTYNKIKDYTFTQAEIGNLFANNDRRHIHKALGV
jgi:SpoVK/Ycf46/Vps4 family AAA+-type ATPase